MKTNRGLWKCLLTSGLLVVASLGTWPAHAAEPIEKFDQFVMRNVQSVEEKLNEKEWEPSEFYLTLALFVGFKIPEVAGVEVVPQITFVWAK